MEIDEQVKLSHLLFSERRCRVCGEVKDLISEFYMTRKNRKDLLSSYSYECKMCTVRRVVENRKKSKPFEDWIYPDW